MLTSNVVPIEPFARRPSMIERLAGPAAGASVVSRLAGLTFVHSRND